MATRVQRRSWVTTLAAIALLATALVVGPTAAPAAAERSPYFGEDVARDLEIIDQDTWLVLDGFGGVWWGDETEDENPFFVSPEFSFDIARALTPAEVASGWILDGWGGIHPYHEESSEPPPAVAPTHPYWPGWDIARDFELATSGGGYVLDGFGAVHPVVLAGGEPPPPLTVSAYFDWDIARDLELLFSPEGDFLGGYVLDGWGGVHPVTVEGEDPPPAPSGGPWWPGHDYARAIDIHVADDGSAGGMYLEDLYGAAHRVTLGDFVPPPIGAGCPYWHGWDIARDLKTADDELWFLDGLGGVHTCPIGGSDAAPVDTDEDGQNDDVDTDDDGDGQSDADEVACGSDPKDVANISPDGDGDGSPNCVDDDDDNDGEPDETDDFPDDPNETVDTDGDGTGNGADTDDDDDGDPDNLETICGSDPLDPEESCPV